MPFELTRHATRQMAFRHISEADIEQALANPYFVGPGNEDGTLVYDAVVGGRGIRIAVVDGSSPPRIVSVMQRRLPGGLRPG